jgi:shikimate dehydrogenase
MVTGTTQLYMIVGHPISQVKSPEIFNEWFGKKGIDAVMIPLDITADGLSAFAQLFRASDNIHGVVVTIPYKAQITPYIDRPSPQVSALGAANVLRRTPAREIEGDMVDGKGFLRALGEKGVSVKAKHIFIIGCGGAGSAIAWAALEAGAAKVSLLNRHHEKAQDLRGRLAPHFPGQDIEAVTVPPARFDIVFNATPLGMSPTDPLPMPIHTISADAVVTDAVTAPPVTPFLVGARKKGHRIQTGREMVIGQFPLIAEYFGIEGLQGAKGGTSLHNSKT